MKPQTQFGVCQARLAGERVNRSYPGDGGGRNGTFQKEVKGRTFQKKSRFKVPETRVRTLSLRN